MRASPGSDREDGNTPARDWIALGIALALGLGVLAVTWPLSRQSAARARAIVELHETSSRRLERYERMGRLAYAISAPSAEVFDSGALEQERQRSRNARAAFQAAIDSTRRDLAALDADVRDALLRDLETVQDTHDALVLDVGRTFASFGVGIPPEIAVINGHLTAIHDALERVTARERAAHGEALRRRVDAAGRLQRWMPLLAVAPLAATLLLAARTVRFPRRREETAVRGESRPALALVPPLGESPGAREDVEPVAPLATTLAETLAGLEQHQAGAVGVAWVVENGASCLRLAAAPSLSPDLAAALDELPTGSGVHTWAAAACRLTVIVEDTSVDLLWSHHRRLAREHGLRACVAGPILSRKGEPLGVLGVFRRRVHAPDEGELLALSAAARQIGMAIERDLVEGRGYGPQERIQAA